LFSAEPEHDSAAEPEIVLPVVEPIQNFCSVEEFTAALSPELVVQDYAAEATVDRHFSAVVIDKPKLPELIHEKIDP
jgi:hypothetical protein